MKKIILLVGILTLVLVSGCVEQQVGQGTSPINCEVDNECWEDSLKTCTPARYIPLPDEHIGTSWFMATNDTVCTIIGQVGDSCKITATNVTRAGDSACSTNCNIFCYYADSTLGTTTDCTIKTGA